MRLLVVDIETRPMESRHWGIWGQNISISQIQRPDGLLCFAGQFVGERKVHFASQWGDGERAMVRAAQVAAMMVWIFMGFLPLHIGWSSFFIVSSRPWSTRSATA